MIKALSQEDKIFGVYFMVFVDSGEAAKKMR